MPSKNTILLFTSLLSILQFAPILVTAVDATSSFRTQTLSAKSLQASTLSTIVNRTTDNEVLEPDVISPGSHNHKHNHEHKARDSCPSTRIWLFNNCHTSVSNGEPLEWTPVAGVKDGIAHLEDMMKGNEKPKNHGWSGGVLNRNCGQVACNKDQLTAIRWCNYNKDEQEVNWEFIKEGAQRIIDDPNCKKDGDKNVVGEAVFYPGVTVYVTGVKECPK